MMAGVRGWAPAAGKLPRSPLSDALRFGPEGMNMSRYTGYLYVSLFVRQLDAAKGGCVAQLRYDNADVPKP